MKEKLKEFENYLEELYPNAECELIYHKDYELLLAVVMSAQTTDKRVNSVTKVLFQKYKTLKELYEADIKDIMEIIRPIGTFQKKARFIQEIAYHLENEQKGIVPNDRNYLENLPGVGRKTTNVVLGVLYQVPTIAVDTHVERVSKRLGLAKVEDNVLDVEKKLQKKLKKEVWNRRHHQMVLFGRYHCKAMSPNCKECKIKDICPYHKKQGKNKESR